MTQATITPSEKGLIKSDVIVVGGGGAGLAAAAEAARIGRRVVVVEKNPELGGSTRLAVGLLMAAGTALQRRAGVADSKERYLAELNDIAQAQGITTGAEQRRLLAENSAETVDFLESIGVDFIGPLAQPPFKTKRFHQALPDGRAYIHCLERHCRALGVRILLGRRVSRLLLSGERVIGIEVRTLLGNSEILTGSDGVVLATGDFSANHFLRGRYLGDDVDSIEAYNAGATGDGHLLALDMGAAIVPSPERVAELATISFPRKRDLSPILHLPPYRAITLSMKLAMNHLPEALLRPFALRAALADLPISPALWTESVVLVNKRGERFAGEQGFSSADIAQQPGGDAYIVFDQRIARHFSAWPNYLSAAHEVLYAYLGDFRRVRPDLYFIADSVAALAARFGASASALETSIASRNAASDLRPPFYALGPLRVKLRHVPVGVTLDAQFRVTRTSGAAVPGLYAVGDVGQGISIALGHGQGLAWAMTSGRLAARSIAHAAASG